LSSAAWAIAIARGRDGSGRSSGSWRGASAAWSLGAFGRSARVFSSPAAAPDVRLAVEEPVARPTPRTIPRGVFAFGGRFAFAPALRSGAAPPVLNSGLAGFPRAGAASPVLNSGLAGFPRGGFVPGLMFLLAAPATLWSALFARDALPVIAAGGRFTVFAI
jgi:hypothetical protein